MHARHLKILGLSLIALVAAMAVNAAGAQAVYKLEGGTEVGGVLKLKLVGTTLEGELLIEPLGAHINCTSGDLKGTLETNAAMTTLSISGHALLLGCTVLDFPECGVESTGAGVGPGEILATGAGPASMVGENTVSTLSSANFTEIVFFDKPDCVLTGISEKLNGSVSLFVEEGEVLKATHLVTLNEAGLFFGTEQAFLDGPGVGNSSLSHVQKEGGGNWAIKL